jgi:hypothetical protein
MGKREDTSPRRTREFDPTRLAALTKQPIPDDQVADSRSEPEQAKAADEISLGRTPTLDDPMTTGLLAEVARRSQTADFDDDLINEVLGKGDAGETSHPHTRRRSR